tara:strand:- start:25999 stop:26925 length:927 start_codon:yes stop_codon:yes gene_type:complete
MKTLYFDVEHGSQTLGSKKAITEKFGLPMLTPSSWDEFQIVIGKIYKSETKKEKIDMGNGFMVEQTVSKIVPRGDFNVDTLVIDTFSELSKKFMRTLTDKSGKMKLQEWGRLKNKLDTCLEFITRLPGNVICTCHSRTQTMDSGENKLMPYIDGSTKEDISKWFDFVFYTKTVTGADGKRKYLWVTNRTEMYDHAKDRTQLLPDEMPQDYAQVLSAAHMKGFEGSKILIIGSPGSGKTYSLKSLVNADVPEPEEEYDPNAEAEVVQQENIDTGSNVAVANMAEASPVQAVEEINYLRGNNNNIQEVTE